MDTLFSKEHYVTTKVYILRTNKQYSQQITQLMINLQQLKNNLKLN